MSVEKLTHLRAKLEELHEERDRIKNEILERRQKLARIEGVIRRYLQFRAETLAEQQAKRTSKKK